MLDNVLSSLDQGYKKDLTNQRQPLGGLKNRKIMRSNTETFDAMCCTPLSKIRGESIWYLPYDPPFCPHQVELAKIMAEV